MIQRQTLVAANWKMNGTLATIRPLLDTIIEGVAGCRTEIAICPPFIYIPELAGILKKNNIQLGAQNVSHLEKGAYTGEVSAQMLSDYHCDYVIVGHSERRTLYAEHDKQIAEKFITVQANGMRPILCVGESLADRETGNTEDSITRQLDAVLELAGVNAFENAIIAYEPIWAIGTGKTANPEQAQAVHELIRQRIARHSQIIANIIRILYGGSVKADNAKHLFEMADIDGGLIGGASLVGKDFITICQA